MLLSICLNFCQVRPGVANKSVAYKKTCIYRSRNKSHVYFNVFLSCFLFKTTLLLCLFFLLFSLLNYDFTTSFLNRPNVDPNSINTLLVISLNKFFFNDNSAFVNSPRSLPRNPLDYIILGSWVFEHFMLTYLQKPCKDLLLVYQSATVYEEVLLLLLILDDNFRVTPFAFLIAGFKLFSCEADNSAFTMLFWVNLY